MFEKLDPETGAPLLDANGKIIMEEMTALTDGIRFKLVPVFDIRQTYGEPLPELVENITGNVAHYNAFLDTLKTVSPLPIAFEQMNDNQDGYCRFGEKIGIRDDMIQTQTICAVVHEMAHARLHDKQNLPENAEPKTKRVKEIESESIAYVVCQHYGIETSPNSFGYLAEYGSRDMSEIKASLDVIRKEANSLITAIDEQFNAICQERGIDLTAKESIQTANLPLQAELSYTTESRTENIAGVDFEFRDVVPKRETDDIMPDPSIGFSEMNLYGYTQVDMLPLTTDRAIDLFNQDLTVYLLFSDNTESMVYDSSEIQNHNGIFGIDRDEWQNSKEYKVAIEYEADTTKYSEAAVESDFIYSKEDKYAIYQIKDDAEMRRNYRFEGLDYLKEHGWEVNRNNYVLVYTAPLTPKDTLENIYQAINDIKPHDFPGHSPSVSDVIVLNKGGEITSHYIDRFGFAELPAFLGVEKQQDNVLQAENDTPAANTANIDFKTGIIGQEELEKPKIPKNVF